MSTISESVRETGSSFLENRKNDSFLKTGFQVMALAVGSYYTVKLLGSQIKSDQAAKAKAQYETNANDPGTAENIAKMLSLAIKENWYGFTVDQNTIMAIFAGPKLENGKYSGNGKIYSREFLKTVQGFYQTSTGRDLMTDLFQHLDWAGTANRDMLQPYLNAINCRSRRVNPATKKIFYVKTC